MDGSMRKLGGRLARMAVGTVVAMATLMGGATVAQADPPRIQGRPALTGTAQVGQTLTASGNWSEADRVAWLWLRCEDEATSSVEQSCAPISDWIAGTQSTYTLTAADEGKWIRAILYVENGEGSDSEVSSAAGPVQPGPSPAPPPPPPPPPPSAPVSADTGGVAPATATAPRMLTPFPTIRIRGRLTPRGARITLLTVTAPRGVRITVRCYGDSCARERWARATQVTRLRRFETRLLAGTRLVIRVTRPGWIGKATTIVIRRGRAPLRRDRCLMPGATRPTRCPDS
jgi:hypothetical protein